MADLLTVEEYKLFTKKNFKKGEEENERDIYYQQILLPGASQTIRSFFNNDFQSISRVETFSTVNDNTLKLFPKHRPVASITSVTIDGQTLDTDAVKLISLEQSFVLVETLNIRPIVETEFWPRGVEHIVITYVGGQALADNLKWMIAQIIARIDDEKVESFSTTSEIDTAITTQIETDTMLRQMMNQFDRPHI